MELLRTSLKGKKKKRFLEILGNAKATKKDVKEAIKIMEDAGGVQHAHDVAMDYAARAKEQLDCLPDSKEKTILLEIVDYMIERDM